MNTRYIIVGYDGSSDARAAADWALDEAGRTGAAVHFVHAVEWPTLMPAASMVPATSVWPDAEAEQARTAMLDDVVASAARTHPRVAATKVMVRGSAVGTLVDLSTRASLLVVGSRGHHPIAGLLLGSVSVAVSAHAHCPVVVVRDGPRESDRSRLPVLVGVDESACAELALGFAAEQAASRDVELHVIRAWRPPADPWEGPAVDVGEVTGAERTTLHDVVARWKEKFPAVDVTTHVVVDHPSRALRAASRAAQLVVVGSRGRGEFRGLMLGSVSQYLLHHAECSVAVVREIPAP
ncbi:MAG TPA: universal stress protein [Actinoplanes sp.]|jgi:nucleotide-binding universal stress UspA family protein